MTTHDMQPEMADPTMRRDQPVEGQPTEPPRETVDATPDFGLPRRLVRLPSRPPGQTIRLTRCSSTTVS